MDEELLITYKRFLEIRYWESGPDELADYDWFILPKTGPFTSMAYSGMLSEHARELSNTINELYCYTVNISAWKKVLDENDQELKYTLILEHIAPFTTLAINSIYIIKSRFIFSIAHLCHQANMVKLKEEWKDDLPNDDEIYFEHADKKGSIWREYKKLKLFLEKIGNKKFIEVTSDFRNKYNHRYPPGIEIGHSEFIKRKVKNERTTYSFGHTNPLKLPLIISELTKQYQHIMVTYEYYKKLIFAHIEAIESSLQEIKCKS